MCYEKVHTCKYCQCEYLCTLKNYLCPTINHDADTNMCELCRARIEEELKRLDDDNER